MQLAIPSAPRAVRLGQVPGALRRVALVAGSAALLSLLVGGLAVRTHLGLRAERAFLEVAQPVTGKVGEVKLPPVEDRGRELARLRVVYRWEGADYAASGVEADAVEAEKLFMGAPIQLLLDPSAPSRPRDAQRLEGRMAVVWLQTLGVGVILLVGAGLVALELRRAVRREVDPLRVGALVWLTPDGALPETKDELRFPAHYFRDDVKHEVTARGRPGRRPVRNGEKVLAAVVPTEPGWVRVIDEDLARTLGWYR